MKYTILSLVAGALISCSAMAENTLTVKMNDALSSGTGENIGEITVSETPYGLLFTPHLNGLTPGIHGFHVHTNPSCMPGMKDGKEVPALMAGGHLDPEKTGKHLGPYNDKGHCCKVSDEAAFCLIQRPYISKTLLTRRISPRGSP